MIYAANPSSKSLAVMLILLGGLGLLAVGAALHSSWIWAVFALLHYVAVCGVSFRYYPLASILLLWFIFMRLTMMLSGVSIESGAFMPEINMLGEANGALVRLEFVFATTIFISVLFINRLLKYFPAPKKDMEARIAQWAYPAFALTIFVCVGILSIGFQNGFPLIEKIDRMVYWGMVESRFLDSFVSNRIILVLLLGVVFTGCNGLKKYLSMALFIMLIVTSVLFSEKFTSLCLMLVYFVTPSFFLRPELVKSLNKRIALLAVAIPALTLPFILIAYGVQEDAGKAMNRLMVRATSQSQLWFVEDQETEAAFKLDAPRALYNVKAITSLNGPDLRLYPPYIGASDFMAEHMTGERYRAYKKVGVKLTMAMEAYLLKLFGYLGMLPAYWFLVAIFCAQLTYIAYGIVTLNPIRIFFGAKLWVWTDHGLNQGLIYSVFGLKSLLFLAGIIGFEIFIRLVLKPKTEKVAL